jgi:hypothetical protein
MKRPAWKEKIFPGGALNEVLVFRKNRFRSRYFLTGGAPALEAS